MGRGSEKGWERGAECSGCHGDPPLGVTGRSRDRRSSRSSPGYNIGGGREPESPAICTLLQGACFVKAVSHSGCIKAGQQLSVTDRLDNLLHYRPQICQPQGCQITVRREGQGHWISTAVSAPHGVIKTALLGAVRKLAGVRDSATPLVTMSIHTNRQRWIEL
ncbi:hypothetical protein SKAU_G00307890 [Synaphobranchus kaupii]|uniref:Uncharacterized protein n=1 Tax=Synaphobranchus kaupii TaxID=118154 RepID=A0A9Q1ER43_SYNKA|nr:hypothetical protein SKAU_G00307890 [Synaphobranchus kaupii]